MPIALRKGFLATPAGTVFLFLFLAVALGFASFLYVAQKNFGAMIVPVIILLGLFGKRQRVLSCYNQIRDAQV